ncbi:hypothetical protein [Streptosporangium jomthongense]|uniref:ABC-type branched-chain amino acid transport system, substrate-binding protein n=1 Tax=Streptosporangium jomthongense TaxID=1193683 RepID=A0ABV8FE32_9ACTN
MASPPNAKANELVSRFRELIMRNTELGRRTPPIVCLFDGQDNGGAANELITALQGNQGIGRSVAISSTHVDVSLVSSPSSATTGQDPSGTTDPDSSTSTGQGPVLPLLHRVYGNFASRKNKGRLRFPRYALASWLTHQRLLSEDAENWRAELRRHLAAKAGKNKQEVTETLDLLAVTTPIPLVGWLLSFLIRSWPRACARLWLSGSLPGWRQRTRWFMRQGYMSPRPAGDFMEFALKLTIRDIPINGQRQIKLLLVHAFLEDLRAAYRRTWRPSTWRRTANPVVLISGVAQGNAGMELLSLINDVRNETGEEDPLLVIAQCDGSDDMWTDAPKDYNDWWKGLNPRPRTMRTDAWRLGYTVSMSEDDLSAKEVVERANLTPPDFPLPARPGVLFSATVAVLFLVGSGLWWAGAPYVRAGCVPLLNHDGVSVALVDDVCVGYSDSADRLFGVDTNDPEAAARLTWVEQAIFRQNACAERAVANDPTRKRLTIVYLAGFLGDEENSRDWRTAQAEEMEGLLLKQIRQNGKAQPDGRCAPASARSYLRIVIANGGPAMRYADQVVEGRISALVRDDPHVIGVVGLDRSIASTEKAIATLGNLGVPVLTTTLSGTNLDQDSPLYFQMVPSNTVQGRLVADYVKSTASSPHPIRHVHVFHPPIVKSASGVPDDLYVASLVQSLEEWLGAARVPYTDHPWVGGEANSDGGLPSACSDRPGDMIFYAGRHERFADFLTAIFSQCNTAGQTVPIITDDAITRFLSDAPNNPGDIPADVNIGFVSKGSDVVLTGRYCPAPTEAPPPENKMSTVLATFCAQLADLYSEHGQGTRSSAGIKLPRWAGERIGLAYDAAGMLLEAASAPYPDRYARLGVAYEPNRAAVAQQLRDKRYSGVIGTYRFGASRVQNETGIAILGV